MLELGLVCFGVFALGFGQGTAEHILPLLVVDHVPGGDRLWSAVIVLRMLLRTMGVICFGFVGVSLGARRSACWTLSGTAAAFAVAAALAPGWAPLVVPLGTSLISIAFINMNAMAQTVNGVSRSRANALYRCAQMLGLSAPPLAFPLLQRLLEGALPHRTLLAGVSLACIVAAMGVGALRSSSQASVAAEPAVAVAPRTPRLTARRCRAVAGDAVVQLLDCFLTPGVAWMSVLAMLAAALNSVVTSYLTLRLTSDLGVSVDGFAFITALGTASAVASMLALGAPAVQRLAPARHLPAMTLGLGALLAAMGLSTSVWPVVAAYVVQLALVRLFLISVSMRTAELAGTRDKTNTVMTAQKLIASAANTFIAVAQAALVETVRVSGLFLLNGAALGACALAMAALVPDASPAELGATTGADSSTLAASTTGCSPLPTISRPSLPRRRPQRRRAAAPSVAALARTQRAPDALGNSM